MGTSEAMRHRLEAAFSPSSLVIEDQSVAHRGHGGWREGGGTHWRVAIRAQAFGPMSRIERHRAVHRALGRDLMAQIHALALEVEG